MARVKLELEDFKPYVAAEYSVGAMVVDDSVQVWTDADGVEHSTFEFDNEFGEGHYVCKPGDIVLEGTRGEHWVVPQDRFEKKYEMNGERIDMGDIARGTSLGDSFTMVDTRSSDNVTWAARVTEVGATVVTPDGRELTVNNPDYDHGAGDMVCCGDDNGKPTFEWGGWPVNGEVFERTYVEADRKDGEIEKDSDTSSDKGSETLHLEFSYDTNDTDTKIDVAYDHVEMGEKGEMVYKDAEDRTVAEITIHEDGSVETEINRYDEDGKLEEKTTFTERDGTVESVHDISFERDDDEIRERETTLEYDKDGNCEETVVDRDYQYDKDTGDIVVTEYDSDGNIENQEYLDESSDKYEEVCERIDVDGPENTDIESDTDNEKEDVEDKERDAERDVDKEPDTDKEPDPDKESDVDKPEPDKEEPDKERDPDNDGEKEGERDNDNQERDTDGRDEREDKTEDDGDKDNGDNDDNGDNEDGKDDNEDGDWEDNNDDDDSGDGGDW